MRQSVMCMGIEPHIAGSGRRYSTIELTHQGITALYTSHTFHDICLTTASFSPWPSARGIGLFLPVVRFSIWESKRLLCLHFTSFATKPHIITRMPVVVDRKSMFKTVSKEELRIHVGLFLQVFSANKGLPTYSISGGVGIRTLIRKVRAFSPTVERPRI